MVLVYSNLRLVEKSFIWFKYYFHLIVISTQWCRLRHHLPNLLAMKRYLPSSILIAVLSIVIACSAYSQDTLSAGSPLKKSWEVAIDLLPLIDKSTSDFNFLLRKNYVNKAVRFKLLFDASSDPALSGNKNFEKSTLGLGLFLGYEWQKNFNNKFQAYYGSDIGYSSTQNKNNTLDDPNGSVYYTVVWSKIQHLRLNPFIGSKYFLTKNIAVSIESTFDIDWYRGNQRSERYQSGNSADDDDILISKANGKSDWYKRYQFIPLYKIYLSYKF